MGDSNLGKLTASLEELSLKKQLPLRQQARKPLLQYTNQLTKPVQLFNQSDIVALRNAANSTGSPYSYGAGGSPYMYMLPTGKVISTRFKGGSDSAVSLSPVSPGSGCSPLPAPPSTEPGEIRKSPPKHYSSSPYNRPMSAKDLANISMHYQKPARKIHDSQSTSRRESISTAASDSTTLQTNSFMRPQTGLRSEKRPQKSVSPSAVVCAEVDRLAETLNAQTLPSDSVSPPGKDACKALIEIGTLVSCRASPGGQTETDAQTNVLGDDGQLKSFQPNCSESTGVCGDGLRQQSRVSLHRSDSTSSNGSLGLHSTSSTEVGSRVRNPHYTPTKPYFEVSETSQQETLERNAPQVLSPLAATPIVSVPVQTRPPSATSVPKSKKGLQFYRKGSKSQEQIHEHGIRLKGDGAPAAVPKAAKEVDRKLTQSMGALCEAYYNGGLDWGSPSSERLPGDGEASVEEFDDDDEDYEDEDAERDEEDEEEGDIEEDFTDDNDSDSYSLLSSQSKRSLSSKSRSRLQSATSCRPTSTSSERRYLRSRSASSDTQLYSALTPSLFTNIPPTINFVGEGEKVEKLPWEIRKFLKWRLSPITPNVVKSALSRSNFRITKRNHDWLGCFGKHMKSQAFKTLQEYQKLNHFPGSFQLGRKDRLWRNLSKMQVHFGRKEFGFFPQTFVLPYDLKLLKRAWEDGGSKQKWIIKPPASARGMGIKVIHKWTQIPRRRPVIVQKYLARPFLINDSKFDMRVYVYVSSCDPLRIYVYEDGLARFASSKYSSSMKNLANKYMHLTNYSINKKNDQYQSNSDETVCQGHKWSLKALWCYLRKQGINTAAIWDSIKDLIVKTVISAEAAMNSLIKSNVKSRYSVHELFGFDILLDEALRPWILEVNISPSLHSNSQLDINIKGNMIKDMFNMAGFRVPDRSDVSLSGSSSSTDLSNYTPSNSYCLDKRQFCGQLLPDERAKHAYYCQRCQDEQVIPTILETLTPDDIRILTESIDEDSRKGGFQRVYPTPNTHRYMRFFEQQRYYNLLLNQWVQRFNRLESKGIALLESFCSAGIHFDMPTCDPNHQWTPPSSSVLSYREPRLASAPVPKANRDSDTDLKARHSGSTVAAQRWACSQTGLRSLCQHFSPSCSQLNGGHTKRSKGQGMAAVLKATASSEPTTPVTGVLGKPPRPPGSKYDGGPR